MTTITTARSITTVVLDTNVFVADFRLQSAGLRLLLHAQRLGAAAIFLPQVVVEETKKKFEEAVVKELETIGRARERLARLLGTELPMGAPAMDTASQRYSAWYDGQIKAFGMSVIPHPNISHGDLVRRALERRKPFTDKGAGYRDALIWATVLELARRHPGPVVLVTNNTSDFANTEQGLHKDLVADLVAHQVDAGKVRLSLHASAAVETHLAQALPPSDDALRVSLENGSYGGFSIAAWLPTAIHGLGQSAFFENTSVATAQLIPGILKIQSIKFLQNLTVTEARRFSGGEVFFEGRAAAQVGLRLTPTLPFQFGDPNGANALTAIAGILAVTMEHTASCTLIFNGFLDANRRVVAAELLDAIGLHRTRGGI